MNSSGTFVSPLTPVDDRADLADSGEAVEGSARFTAYCRLRHYGMSPGLAFQLTQAGYASSSIASFLGAV